MSPLTLTIIRGLPGSGKTTLAKSLMSDKKETVSHIEADMFFVDAQGDYKFDAAQLAEAHRWCKQQCELCLKKRQSVIVSNTFIRQWEMAPYRQLAEKYNASLIIKVCSGCYQSVHNVPADTLKIMKKKWQA